MRIAVNTRLLLAGRLDGIGWFSAESLRRIVCEHPEHEFFFLFDRKPDPQFIFASNVHPVVLAPQARHPLLWTLFFDVAIPLALKRLKADLFLSPDGWMSLRTNVPTLTVIHDLNFEHASDFLRPSHQRYMKRHFPIFAKKATRIATVSQFSKQDIATTYGINPDKIDVVYDGSHSSYQPLTETEQDEVRKKYSDGQHYYIYVGTISRRKNLSNILLAFDSFKQATSSKVKMICVGERYWWGNELRNIYDNMHHRNDVVFLGHIESNELSRLMASSIALVYPSLFEGFGIPILEAFQAETAVITANVTSMPEVAGDAALLVDPLSADEIASAMRRLYEDDNLRSTLIEAGRKRRDLFSWDRTARLLYDSIMTTAKKTE